MKFVSLLFVMFVVACGGVGSRESDVLNDPVVQPEPEPEPGASIITLDNHDGIVANVFARFSGKLYGEEILTAPGYSDPAYES